mmetsp:Transcript_20436/g.66353  ORF Transcript_20436/g.66353 Transcript_20436/m.66353 type:complete len:909 (-) Transcript_20436:163-2889(-)|eukprot:CAMPEP_0170148338 /NCGR_PEP_ID=MMETSP0033_2-20121228/38406_1 /TAXON_ID=195969 /ORGANISM="Dolichomastix tenuilepis, Strain CCMP3274" /LENGTH=908 /DNA_ID=CAMNT_0010385215 /DNA_START=70 /DNA_END=2796 /DNA_ORIENTATION=+
MEEPIYEDATAEEEVSFLPPFANEANKDLDRHIRGLEKEREQSDAALEENKDRVGIMNEHLRNVQQELVYTQSRCDAKNNEIETEDHLKQLNERATGRMREEVKKLEKEQYELGDKLNALQNSIYQGNEKMDQFKLLMNWNQEELEQWALASRQKEEDNLALQKYQRADESRIKELNLAIEKMNRAVNSKKKELEGEVTETQAAQIQLDKTAEDFRALHLERQELVRQWEEAVEAMKRRDLAIQAASERFAAKKTELREKQGRLDERARFLEQEQANNREIDARIAIADRGMTKLRLALTGESDKHNETNDEVEVLKNTLSKTANELAVARSTNKAMQGELEGKRLRLEKARKKLGVNSHKLETEYATLDTLEKKSEELASVQEEEEEQLKAVQKLVVTLKERMFKSSQELFALRTQERDLIAEIAGGQSQNKNLSAKIAQLDQQVVKQQEMLYNAEFQIQQLERKVSRAGGERTDEEKKALNARIEALTAVLEERNAEHSMLSASVKRAEDDLHSAQRRNQTQNKDLEHITGKINELTLESDSAIRSLKGAVTEKEEKMVSHDIIKLEVKRLRDLLNTRTDEVYSLENRKFQLQMSMEERKHEIEVHREVLRSKLKTQNEEIHRATLELKERALRVNKLQNKYEVLLGRMKQEDDGDDEDKSQAYYVIKAAQEREELQREGDQLDAKIRKAEKEVHALEGTLYKLTEKNALFRGSYRRVEDSEALSERRALREQLDRTYDKMKAKRNEERSLQQDVEQHDARLANLQREEGTLAKAVQELGDRARGAQEELQAQAEKQERAEKMAAKLRRELHQRTGVEEELDEELDFRLAELKEGNRAILHEIKQAALASSEVQQAFDVAGVKLPSGGAAGLSGRGSRAPSEASDASVRSDTQRSAVRQRAVQFAP